MLLHPIQMTLHEHVKQVLYVTIIIECEVVMGML